MMSPLLLFMTGACFSSLPATAYDLNTCSICEISVTDFMNSFSLEDQHISNTETFKVASY